MLKEIHEPPRAARDTLLGRVVLEEGEVHLEELGTPRNNLRHAERVLLLAWGRAGTPRSGASSCSKKVAHGARGGRLRSEFRYRTPRGKNTLAVAITQSGETADTTGRLPRGQAAGRVPIAIFNVQGSQVTTRCCGVMLTHAGPEIGVASTKAFTSQIVALAFGPAPGPPARPLSQKRSREHPGEQSRVPHLMENALAMNPRVDEVAKSLVKATDFLYLGRGINYPLALEGALKMKEISYIHAEGYRRANETRTHRRSSTRTCPWCAVSRRAERTTRCSPTSRR